MLTSIADFARNNLNKGAAGVDESSHPNCSFIVVCYSLRHEILFLFDSTLLLPPTVLYYNFLSLESVMALFTSSPSTIVTPSPSAILRVHHCHSLVICNLSLCPYLVSCNPAITILSTLSLLPSLLIFSIKITRLLAWLPLPSMCATFARAGIPRIHVPCRP
ncbi:hypothetical protein HN51_006122 [Arachis hypogaea]